MDRIGKFDIVEKIGSGGFGAVYKGFDPFIKRYVAVKTCTAIDEEIRVRFFQEAEIAGNLHHRNVTTVYDFGVQDDLPYLVQEYLSGEDLDRKIKRKDRLPFEDKHAYLEQVARGLAYAHGKGVVHRDVKPGNVRILEDGTVKIMDFGIAKLMAQESELTRTGMTVGTAAYLAPEQIRGEPADPRTDVFSFGVLAYELLTYRRPFEGEQISAVLYQILHHQPNPIRSTWQDCPEAIQDIVERCLHKDPEQRFAHCAGVLEALEGFVDGPGTGAPGEPGAESARSERPVGDLELDLAPRERPDEDAIEAEDAVTLAMPSTGHLPTGTYAAASSTSPRRTRWLALAAALLVAVAGLGFVFRDQVADLWPRSEAAVASAATAPGAPPDTVDEAGASLDLASGQEATVDPPVGTDAVVGEPVTDGPIGDAAGTEQDAVARGSIDPSSPVEPPAEPPPVVPPPPAHGTLVLAAAWDAGIEAQVGDGRPVALGTRHRLELPPGRHVVHFRIDRPGYRATRDVTIDLASGAERTLSAPFSRPGQLSISAAIGHPQGLVWLDGESRGRTPIQLAGLAPGSYSLEIRPLDEDESAAIRQSVTVEPAAETRVTFDLDTGGPAVVVVPGSEAVNGG